MTTVPGSPNRHSTTRRLDSIIETPFCQRLATIALLVALGVVAFLAVRRVRIPGWQKVLVLLAEVVLGAAVIGLELLAHG